MTDELARRIGVWLTATGRWRPGMLMRDCENGDMIRLCWSDGMYWHCYYPIHGWLRIVRETMRDRYAPNITDGATRGGLEDILRERWPHAEVTWAAEDWEDKKPVGGWFCECGTAEMGDDYDAAQGATPGEAVARAIVAAYDIEEAP
jgi:hypothetical protein